MSNMRIWDQLKATDPKYTKKVEFGRKFTSINSQWQLQQMTAQFGPVGQGWGYSVSHSVERISDDYVLAIADVTIWTHGEGERRNDYGPVRGMSPILEKNRYDDDAGKKAMTDALTKGLSHLGLSADVFLGLYDDNKYVQRVAQQFANGNGHEAPFAGNTLEQARKEIEQETGNTQSQYEVDKLKKAVAAGWKVVNTTPKGQEDQLFAYLEMARNPADISAIASANSALIKGATFEAEFDDSVDRLLRWMEKQSAPVLQ